MDVVVSAPQRSEFTDFIEQSDFSQTTTCPWLSQISDVAPENRIFKIGKVDFFWVPHWVQMSLREV